MRCDEAQRLTPLYLYGDLLPADEERFEAHVHECDSCRRDMERQSRLHGLLDSASAALPEGMLTAARQQLRRGLTVEPRRTGFAAWVRDAFSLQMHPAPIWMQAAAAVALVAAGFVSARVVPGGWGIGASSADIAGTPIDSRVQYVEPAGSGRVQVVVDETRERVLSGTPQDAPIRRLLLAALHDAANPAVRVQSVEQLKNHCGSADIRDTMLDVLQHDPDPGVRLEALEGLKPYASEPQMRDVFTHVLLADQNPGIRTQVIGVLVQQQQDEVVGAFQELMRREDDRYVRQQCSRALHAMKASTEEY